MAGRLTVTKNKKTNKWEVRSGGSVLSRYRLKSQADEHANEVRKYRKWFKTYKK